MDSGNDFKVANLFNMPKLQIRVNRYGRTDTLTDHVYINLNYINSCYLYIK